MKLSEMEASTHGRVRNLGKDARFLNRITSIGLTEGATFQVVRNDKKMPVLVYVRETLLACLMALSTTYKESHSLKWTLKTAGFYVLAALILSCIVYHIAAPFIG